MHHDPIVEEVRAAREKIAAEHDFDLHKLFSHWRRMEQRHPDRVVSAVRGSREPGGEGKRSL
jgi:hypothetical protein